MRIDARIGWVSTQNSKLRWWSILEFPRFWEQESGARIECQNRVDFRILTSPIPASGTTRTLHFRCRGVYFFTPLHDQQATHELHRFQAQVDRGDIVISADKWPTFLYDEVEYDENDEWKGLFLGETFVRVSLSQTLVPLFHHSQRH